MTKDKNIRNKQQKRAKKVSYTRAIGGQMQLVLNELGKRGIITTKNEFIRLAAVNTLLEWHKNGWIDLHELIKEIGKKVQ